MISIDQIEQTFDAIKDHHNFNFNLKAEQVCK